MWGLAAGILAASAVMGGHSASAGVIRGDVQAADGSPAKGAKVWTARLWAKPLDRREAVADERGGFKLDAGPGDWLVWASIGGQGGEVRQPIKVQAGEDPEPIRITLAGWGRLRGRLIEAEGGKPIAGGKFALDNGLVAVADDQGRFEATGLRRIGYHEAFVVAPGRARMRVLFVMSDRPETELEVQVPRAGKIVGRVADEQGRPVPGAWVGRSTSGSAYSTTALFDRCDDQGRFEYDGVPFDRPARLSAEAGGFQGQERDDLFVDPKGRSLALDFKLMRTPEAPQAGEAAPAKPEADLPSEYREVTGVVLGPGDRPVAGAEVRWGAAKHSETPQAKAGEDGRFRLPRIPDRDGMVTVIAPGSKLAPFFALVRRGGKQHLRVTLVEGRSARGVVRDDRGEPIAGVLVVPVIASPDPSRGDPVWLSELEERTDAQGRFEISGLPVAGVKIDFMHPGLSDLRNQVLKLDGPDNSIRMVAGGAILGRVVDPDGKPVRNFRVLLNISKDRRPGDNFGGFFAGFSGIGLTYTSEDGSFVVKDLAAGSVQRLSVIAPGFGEGVVDRARAEPENHLSPDKALTIRLAPPHALKVRAVEAGTGRPIADARVSLIYDDPSIDQHFAWGYHDASWGDEARVRSGTDGWAEFPPLAFGEATLVVRAPGRGRLHQGWRDGAREVTVELEPEAVVSGQIVDKASGRPLDGIHVRLQSKQGEQITASIGSADGGRFSLAELPAGDYALTVSIDFGSEFHREEVTLKAGESLERSLRLSKSDAK